MEEYCGASTFYLIGRCYVTLSATLFIAEFMFMLNNEPFKQTLQMYIYAPFSILYSVGYCFSLKPESRTKTHFMCVVDLIIANICLIFAFAFVGNHPILGIIFFSLGVVFFVDYILHFVKHTDISSPSSKFALGLNLLSCAGYFIQYIHAMWTEQLNAPIKGTTNIITSLTLGAIYKLSSTAILWGLNLHAEKEILNRLTLSMINAIDWNYLNQNLSMISNDESSSGVLQVQERAVIPHDQEVPYWE